MLDTLMSVWIFTPTFWLIIGIALVVMELVDGSFVFFLPLGIGSFGNALLTKLANSDVALIAAISDTWYSKVVTLGVIALVAAYGLRLYSHRKNSDQSDINDY